MTREPAPPRATRRHIHLDPVGGVAGDMFAAALLDAEPSLEAACVAAAETVARVPCRVLRHHDSVLTGARFVVRAAPEPAHGGHGHHHRHDADGHPHRHHGHAAWTDIRARLHTAALPEPVRRHAIGIFAVLAEAEAQVHGIEPEAVTFHEVGAVDSIADIVAAACLIAGQATAAGEATWSTAPLPLGGGRVQTAHGVLPVPAPATALLLRDFPVMDDGVSGERVTPTGAAILRYLGAQAPAPPGARWLRHTGIGFGTRTLPGLPNVLRALVFESAGTGGAAAHDRRDMAVIAFEVDDQTAEDLATGLDRLRGLPGVLDVAQMPAFGKKGRMAAHIQVLALPDAQEAAIEACFRETTTLGLRVQAAEGRVLRRSIASVSVDGRMLRVKRAERPGGATGKVESDDVADGGDHAARQRLRGAGEQGT